MENISNLQKKIIVKREELVLIGMREGLCSEVTLHHSSELDRLIQLYQQKTTFL